MKEATGRAAGWSRMLKSIKDFFISQSASSLDLGVSTLPGIVVTEESALTFSAVYSAIKVLSESVASLPLFLHRRTASGKEPDRDHPLFTILHDLPNPEITSCEFREMMMAHALMSGNAYAEIERNPLGDIVALWPISPHRVEVGREDLQSPLRYRVTLPQGARAVTLPKEKVFHLRALALDGVTGISPIKAHREAIGLGLAAAEFGGRFFSQGLNAGGTMEHPRTLGDDAYKRLKESIDEKHSGLDRSHRILILEEGMKFNKTTIPPEDAQWLQTRKFQVTEIARIYRIPPHKLGDLEKATFSNIEEQSIEFVTDTLTPWLIRWEQAIMRDLLLPEERADLFAEFKLDALLRGKTSERFAAYATARQWGWFSVNDILSLENRNGIGAPGNIYLSPMNMLTAEEVLASMQETADAPFDVSKLQRAHFEAGFIRRDELRTALGLSPLGGTLGSELIAIGGPETPPDADAEDDGDASAALAKARAGAILARGNGGAA